MKKIAYSKSSLKTLRKIPAPEAERIMSKVEQYAKDPESLASNVKHLKGSPFLRLRVADWRVIFDEDGNVLRILKIGARGSVYE